MSIYRHDTACGFLVDVCIWLPHTYIHTYNIGINRPYVRDTYICIYKCILVCVFRLKLLAEQYQAREKHLEKLNEQVQLESQLHQAKLTKAQVEAAMEKEILTK